MEFRTCLATAFLLAATFIPWALSQQAVPPRPPCSDGAQLEIVDPLALRGELPVVSCAPGDGTRAPRGAAGLLFGRRIDVNAATVEELQALPEVGPGRARRIAAERDRGGAFRSLADLRRVQGLGSKRLRSLADWAVVEARARDPSEM
jgi:competence ComEA-like helix-hairpin-helix protein